MKPQQLAHLLNLAPTTLRRWAREYGEFLSPSGRGSNGAYRTYNDRDGRIIAWIATMRAQNIAPGDIALTLRTAQADNWRALPPMPGGLAGDEPIAVIPREAAEERLTAIQERYELQLQAALKQRDDLQAQLAESKADAERLRQQLTEAHEQIVALSKDLASLVRKRSR